MRNTPALLVLVVATAWLTGCKPAAPESAAAPAAPEARVAEPVVPTTPVEAAADVATSGAVDSQAHFDGYGDMKLGSTIDEARAAWGGELHGAAANGSTCHYLMPTSVKSNSEFAFMMEDGKFVRYDVGTTTEIAPGGGKVGMVVEQLKLLYGDALQSAPHKYLEGGKVFSVAAPDGTPAKLLFEADGAGKVTAWHVGLPPQVDYAEGCS